jgi:hypothetical protein
LRDATVSIFAPGGQRVFAVIPPARAMIISGAMHRPRTLGIVVLLIAALLPAGVLARAKTDLVFIGKADRITGEITQMSRGILTLSTDNIGTVNIEWEDVDSLNSVYHFRVEDRYGRKLYGAIFMTKVLTLQVIHAGKVQAVAAADVVSITPLEATFWQRLDGSIGIGFSFTQANSLAQLTSNFNVRYRTPLRLIVFDSSTIYTTQEDEDTQQRNDISLTYNRLFSGRFFALASAGAQTNEELGLDLRLSFAPGLGLNVVKTNHNDMVATTGLSVNREWSGFSDGGANLEAFASLAHSVFRYDYPKSDITLEATLFPSLSTWGRLRSEIDISVSRELIRDLTFVLSFYDSYDNQPLDPAADHNDYGLVTSLGWTF